MKTSIQLILLILAIIFSGEVFAEKFDQQQNWTLKKDEDGIQIYLNVHQEHEAKLKAFKGVARINASLDSVMAVIFDLEACTDWLKDCADPVLINDVSFTERYHYQVQELPFPTQNRDVILHSIVTQNPVTKTVTIEMEAAPDYCNNKTSAICQNINDSPYVRVRHLHGTYILEPQLDGSTRITWKQHTDPGGMLPNWLINQLVQNIPFFGLKGLIAKVREEKYQLARLVYNPSGIAIAFNEHKKG